MSVVGASGCRFVGPDCGGALCWLKYGTFIWLASLPSFFTCLLSGRPEPDITRVLSLSRQDRARVCVELLADAHNLVVWDGVLEKELRVLPDGRVAARKARAARVGRRLGLAGCDERLDALIKRFGFRFGHSGISQRLVNTSQGSTMP